MSISPDVDKPFSGELPTGDLIFDVVKRDLGLELQPGKEEIEMPVIDHANRAPAGN